MRNDQLQNEIAGVQERLRFATNERDELQQKSKTLKTQNMALGAELHQLTSQLK
jgi:hypothetical protein